MTLDVVCAGPVFLDLTFEGLAELPTPGRERFARELHETPGGAGITATGLARLGLRTAVAAALGRDIAGVTLRTLLEADGIICVDSAAGRTPVTVALPIDGERAFVTYEPSVRVGRDVVESLRPQAVVVGIDQLDLVLAGTRAYVSVDDREAERHAGALPPQIRVATALLANRHEAARLTGESDAAAAALALAEEVPTAVVTRGADGAVAASGGEVFETRAPAVEVRDTTGAGDLFVAAYVWGDLAGLPLAERLRRAAVYATLSVRSATGVAGAATLDELERALAEFGPATVETASTKESS